MIVRIVKMEFQQSKVNTFLDLFESVRDKIATFDGCMGLQLLNSINTENMYFTYSTWKSEQHLENYRNSELFKQTWSLTKELFCNKPEAWSLTQSGTAKPS
ncbi:MAG TPA: antibiotic biosynthesis monooxygenase family protein [Bacteroidia bacterium]|jgi:quinol monooxygenase YgiN|nr:antibiotic biosynthesis monooxygenase family protein [Bacteroidia bacterium]